MNGCAIQQSAFTAGNEMRPPLVCPKPRRVGLLAVAPEPIRAPRWQPSLQMDPSDLKAGVELLDLFLTQGEEQQVEPFFCGSPPTRSANPLVNDARFGEAAPVNDLQPPLGLTSPVHLHASSRMGSGSGSGCARTKFGFAPAAVRVEGFDCLDRDRSRSRGIPAVA